MAIFLIISDQKRIVAEEIAKIVNKEDETIRLDFNFLDFSNLIQEISYRSLFETQKNLIVYNSAIFSSTKINETEEEKLISLLEKPLTGINLLFVNNEKEDSRRRITKIVKEKGQIINLLQISYNSLLEKTKKYAEKYKFSLDKETIKYLLDLTNQKYDLICNELDKIFLYYNNIPCHIELNDLKNVCAPNIKDNNFKFVEAVVNKNMKLSFSLLKDLKTLKVEPSILLALIIREYRLILEYNIALKNNLLPEYIKNWHLQDWQLNKVVNNLKKYSSKNLSKIIIKLSDYDYKLKSGQIDRNLILDLLLLDLY